MSADKEIENMQAKMEKLHKFLSCAIDQFLMEFAIAKFAPDTSKQGLPLKEELVLVAEKQYQRLVQAVSQEVSGLVDLLGDVMRLK